MNKKNIEFFCKAQTFIRRQFLKKSSHFKNINGIKLSHITYYACNNVGDTVLSATVRKGFEQEIGNIKWDLFDVSERITEKSIQKYNRSCAVIIGGGGLFLPDTNKNAVSGWQWSCSSEQLNKIHSPIILFAIGFNYFRGQKVNDLFVDSLIEIVNKSSFIGLRNHGSISEVKKIIPERLWSKIEYQPCLTTVIRKLDYSLPMKTQNNTVAFNIAFDRIEDRLGNQKDAVLNQIAKSVCEIQKKGYDVYYIAHIVKDLEFLEYLKKFNIKIKVKNASSWSTTKLIKFYNNMDVVIGMRGHAQMIPFGVNCHIITLGSHNKMRWFLEDINALDWYIELNEDVKNLCCQIVKKFEIIHEIESEETDKRIIQAQNELYKITCGNFQKIKKELTIR